MEHCMLELSFHPPPPPRPPGKRPRPGKIKPTANTWEVGRPAYLSLSLSPFVYPEKRRRKKNPTLRSQPARTCCCPCKISTYPVPITFFANPSLYTQLPRLSFTANTGKPRGTALKDERLTPGQWRATMAVAHPSPPPQESWHQPHARHGKPGA